MPDDAAAFSLLDILSETGYQASLVATYCCYFPFYEEVVLRRLLNKGCTNNVLMVDARSCAEAFEDDVTRPRRAGRDYTLVPVHMRGSFHPKLIVALGRSKGVLFVGSHNMTLAGFGLNDELTNQFRTSAAARHGAEVIRSALDYLRSFVPPNLTDIDQVFGTAARNIPWLDGPVPVEPRDRIFMATTGRDSDLWSRIRPLVPKRPSTVFVCGPFFDRKLSFLQRLLDDVKPGKLIVGVDPESVEMDMVAAHGIRGAEFVNISGLPRVPNRRVEGARYLHAKILWFQGSDGELLVTGSANPSEPAYMATAGSRNAEAVVIDRRDGAAKTLGLDVLASAPRVKRTDWERVAARHTDRAASRSDASGSVVLAVPTDEGFTLEHPIGEGLILKAYGADGSLLGQATTGTDNPTEIHTADAVRDGAQTLRGNRSRHKPVVVLVHRPHEVGRHVGGNRQRELRKALGALEEDPTQLDALLALTQKVIFESDEVIRPESPIRKKPKAAVKQSHDAGPESLAVDAAGRRVGRRRRRLASGDILVLLDALMYRLREGMAGPASPPSPSEEILPPGEDDVGDEDTMPPPQYERLAETCRRKVGSLVRRMVKQLGKSRSEGARRGVVQLAAVLSVVYTLRRMEQRAEWRSRRLELVDRHHECQLFEDGGLALTWGNSSLALEALKEGDGEAFQELSLAIGLLAWLAWDVAIDVRGEVERTRPINREEEDEPWYWIQIFAAVAIRLADDSDARETLSSAVAQTKRRDADSGAWLATHLELAERLSRLSTAPESFPALARAPRAGDLIILGSALDPRVRVALEVVPSGATDKVKVYDANTDAQKRQFLATHISHVGWWEEEVAPLQIRA